MTSTILITLILASIGILDTLYLSYHTVKKTLVKCLFFPEEWCRKVQKSKYSKMMGIPNSFLGLGMYLLMLVLALLFHYGLIAIFAPVLVLIGFGFLFSMYFLYVQAFILRAFCTWCVVSAVNFTLLVLLVLLPELI